MARPQLDPKIRYSDIITWAVLAVTLMGVGLKMRDSDAADKVQIERNSENIEATTSINREINARQDVKLTYQEIWQIKHDAKIEALQEAGIDQ
jgi:hypothetical protein